MMAFSQLGLRQGNIVRRFAVFVHLGVAHFTGGAGPLRFQCHERSKEANRSLIRWCLTWSELIKLYTARELISPLSICCVAFATSLLARMDAEATWANRFWREMLLKAATAHDHDETHSYYYLQHAFLRGRIQYSYGRPDVGYGKEVVVNDPTRELDWMKYAGVHHAEEYQKRRPRSESLRLELSSDENATRSLQNVMGRMFNTIRSPNYFRRYYTVFQVTMRFLVDLRQATRGFILS
ncbi:uncharacterized protein CC84DRAFT_325745 [Paraphaeosphaeria sporulosa]|uniref:Uncharacterized protein n=1 Tax=Paraphaeosphaeria sporulosa TaxID=1460663 RepID=A0A177BWL0_9PLEO|nr:uncharacterized protein CC84DRAFT_325745 [Paraphaeosphaeria sporulosa]OAF99873.1 hypothetical protein CC84DRAFT_325745 [Paraphaeosphaeria sporulosa]